MGKKKDTNDNRMAIMISVEHARKLKVYCAKHMMTIKEVIEEFINNLVV